MANSILNGSTTGRGLVATGQTYHTLSLGRSDVDSGFDRDAHGRQIELLRRGDRSNVTVLKTTLCESGDERAGLPPEP